MTYSIRPGKHHKPKEPEWELFQDGVSIGLFDRRSKACTHRDEIKVRDALLGKRLCQQEPLNADGQPTERRTWFVEPGGKSFSGTLARDLIERGVVRPTGDALFPGMSQTYELVE